MQLRVLSYNIHKCIGGVDRRYDPLRVAETIAHHAPDVVLLQEVDHEAKRSLHHRQVDVLGDLLGYRHRSWFANVKVRGGGEYGNAVLSRFPVMETRNIDLTIPPKKRRGALHVRLRVRIDDGHSRTLHVYNLHLGLAGFERKLQLKRFFDSHPFAGLHERAAVIVGGDLNDVYGTLGRKLFAPVGFRGDVVPATFPAWAPVRALDGIYVRGACELKRVQRSRYEVARRASDHLPLIADLEID